MKLKQLHMQSSNIQLRIIIYITIEFRIFPIRKKTKEKLWSPWKFRLHELKHFLHSNQRWGSFIAKIFFKYIKRLLNRLSKTNNKYSQHVYYASKWTFKWKTYNSFHLTALEEIPNKSSYITSGRKVNHSPFINFYRPY